MKRITAEPMIGLLAITMKSIQLLKPLSHLALLAAFFPASLAVAEPPAGKSPAVQVDEAQRFIFHSVLEGLYEDGLSTEDVARILMRKEGQCYYHFILACPICTAAIWALEAYQQRPEQLYGVKRSASTFGPGLSEAQHRQLNSDDSVQRLTVINSLMRSWMERRMKSLRLSEKERASLLSSLEKKRKEGMDQLESFRRFGHGPELGVDKAAPAYANLKECAVCNAAVGKPMKLPDAKQGR